MSHHPTAGDWGLIAAVTTIVYIAAVRWCMPTPKTKRRMSFAPLAGCVYLVPAAAIKDYSVSLTLYLYSSVLLTFVIMMVPARKRIAADILEQEQNPGIKVQVNTATLWWLGLSLTGCIAAMVYFRPFIE
ncbi:hypothetical protein ACFWOT_36985 [Streptomyces sp. NPDC058440]|uniref:hypothetical protein n=1 Tax=Streptomyces sp. NPDC058440 TaxID=3346501 RepID=UPI00365F7DB3